MPHPRRIQIAPLGPGRSLYSASEWDTLQAGALGLLALLALWYFTRKPTEKPAPPLDLSDMGLPPP